MAGKLREMTPALKRNINVLMVNALKPGRVFHALKGEEVTGTTLMR
jgi:isopentenyl phosphate kinase